MFLLIILITDIIYKEKYTKLCMLYYNNHSFSYKIILKLCTNNSFSYNFSKIYIRKFRIKAMQRMELSLVSFINLSIIKHFIHTLRVSFDSFISI